METPQMIEKDRKYQLEDDRDHLDSQMIEPIARVHKYFNNSR